MAIVMDMDTQAYSNSSIQDVLAGIDWGKLKETVKEKVKDYGPVITVLRNTWSHETLKEIIEGKVFVSDEVMNDIIAKNIREDSNVTSVLVTSTAKERLEILADTKNMGKIKLSGTIEEFVHDGGQTYVTYKVRERSLPEHGLGSWIFSRLSLSMTQKLMGNLSFSDEIPTKISGNTIRVDLSKALAATDFAKTEFRGHRLADMLRIEGAKPKKGGIEIDTGLHVPDDVKESLLQILK